MILDIYLNKRENFNYSYCKVITLQLVSKQAANFDASADKWKHHVKTAHEMFSCGESYFLWPFKKLFQGS